MVVDNIGTIGGKPVVAVFFLQGSGIGSTSFWVGDMGDYPPHGPALGLGGGWVVSTWWSDVLQGRIPRGAWTEVRSTLHWRWI